MRCLVLGVLVLWLLACGPSAAQLHTARTATYRTKATELLSIAEAAASEDYTIGDRNPAGLELITQPHWYSPEGGRQSAGAGDFVQLDDRSVQLALIIQVTEVEPLDGTNYTVTIIPKVFQHIAGSPKPRELSPDDPNVPGWVQGRVDSLYLAIHQKAKQYQSN